MSKKKSIWELIVVLVLFVAAIGCNQEETEPCILGVWATDSLTLGSNCYTTTQYLFNDNGTGQLRALFCPDSCQGDWVYTRDFEFEINDEILTLDFQNNLKCGSELNQIAVESVNEFLSCSDNEMVWLLETYYRIE